MKNMNGKYINTFLFQDNRIVCPFTSEAGANK